MRALRRFWWVLVLGAVIALVAGLSARFSISLFPPSLDEKEEISYTASSRLLVSSAEAPYIRSQKTTFVEQPNRGGDEETEAPTDETEEPSADGASATAVPFVTAPDLNTLARVANLYPLIIESDQVADFRQERYGDLPGIVTATGIYSVATANRVELSEIPVIQLVSVAGTPDDAIALADKTAKSFIGWMGEEQKAANILPEDRIVVQQMTVPRGAVASEGPSTTLPVLVFLVVFAAFCVLAILLDRLIPLRPRPARTDVDEIEAPVSVKKTA